MEFRTNRDKLPGKTVVKVQAVCWNRDAHHLFDYDNSYYNLKNFVISDSTIFYRKNNEIMVKSSSNKEISLGNGEEHLLSVRKTRSSKDEFILEFQNDLNLENRIYHPSSLVVRSLKVDGKDPQRGYNLRAGIIFKLARIEFRVLEVFVNDKIQQNEEFVDEITSLMPALVYDSDSESRKPNYFKRYKDCVCKYCLVKDSCDDPLLNLMIFTCKCREGVHFECLRSWIAYKIVSNVKNQVIKYEWTKLECELCRVPLPRRVRFQSRIYELIQMEKPLRPYIIIEQLSEITNASSSMSIIMPKDHNDIIKIGRSEHCEVKVSHSSISKFHAQIRLSNGKFLLFDSNSKYGSSVLLTKNYPVLTDKAAVQIGRTVFTFYEEFAPDTKTFPGA
jgi:hypothetical protein